MAACGGYLLIRDIGQTGRRDGVGCYPVFSCSRPEALADDLAALPEGLVALTLVPDPLLDFRPDRLQQQFPIVRSLGEHYIVDLEAPSRRASSHHRRMVRKAAAYPIEIRIETDPSTFLDHWVALYEVLIEQARIEKLRRFSPAIFAAMLKVPGTLLFTAWEGADLLGADWYLVDADRVYAHLSAYSLKGYARSVSYPMMDAALAYFTSRARVLDLGGVPTLAASGNGLAHFKAGWSTGRLPAYLCGVDLHREAYLALSQGRPPSADEFFPHYRVGDYG